MNRRSFGKALMGWLVVGMAAPLMKHVPAAPLVMTGSIMKIAIDAAAMNTMTSEEAFDRLLDGVVNQKCRLVGTYRDVDDVMGGALGF